MENKFIDKIIKQYNLGEPLTKFERVLGGFLHQIVRVETTKGKYAIKLLNCSIMSRNDALKNFSQADYLEQKLKLFNIPAVYAMEFNGKLLQMIDGKYFYIYAWFEGQSIFAQNITTMHCKKIGECLANIHNIEQVIDDFCFEKIDIDWGNYLSIAKCKNIIVYNELNKYKKILIDFCENYNKYYIKLPKIKSICHNDLDPKNVMWNGEDFKLIDLECLSYSSPYIEFFECLMYWCGLEQKCLKKSMISEFIEAYFANSKIDKNIDWNIVYYSNFSRINWIKYNLEKTLDIGTEAHCENNKLNFQNEVIKNLEIFSYYFEKKQYIINCLNA